jgi:hypothetical protein
MNCLARTRLVPTALRDADFETALEPERFVPTPLSEYRILVEIMHEGRVVLTQAVQLDADEFPGEYVLLQRDFPAYDGDGPAFPSPVPAAGVPIATWQKEINAFFNSDWDARLSVLHAPSGRVVCLGVQSCGNSCASPPRTAQDGPPYVEDADLNFHWRVRTPILPESVFKQIEDGFSEINFATRMTIDSWDSDLGATWPIRRVSGSACLPFSFQRQASRLRQTGFGNGTLSILKPTRC